MGGGREGKSTFLWFPSWWVRLLFHKGPPGGGSSQQATCSGPSLGPDTPSGFRQVQTQLGSALEEGKMDKS